MKSSDMAIIVVSAAGLMEEMTVKKHHTDKKTNVIRNVNITPVPCGIPYIYGIL